ncbi:hypothetical protein KIL84_013693 [Mauremys mutica]|uniref:Uncharacterized protein n=1 Tax=Mauremys mutica TaxID=74926 RepID=A0A9D3WXD4_9SAUR|nr:hypothetical protein KIL84_013693 [Mauremys mutica]
MEDEKIQTMATKETLLNLNAKSKEAAFETTARVFRTAYYIAKTNQPLSDHESLIDLQQINGIEMGPSTDGIMRPLTFPLDLIELQSATAAAIKGEILKCLLCCGFTKELVLEVLISFCSDGANVMLGVKAGVGKLLQMDFSNVILWHCLNQRLELAVDEALEVTRDTNDFKAFLDALYSLYNQSPKNSSELSDHANELHVVLQKIGKMFKCSVANIPWFGKTLRSGLTRPVEIGSECLKFQGLHSKLCSVNFIRNLSLMLDVLTN